MKKFAFVSIVLIMCISLVACGSEGHDGEAKTPSGSSAMKGRMYEDVYRDFEEAGFTNIESETIPDLVFGFFTKENEVEKVTVGGDEQYSPDKWMPTDTEVVIFYHVYPEESETSDTDAKESEDMNENEIVEENTESGVNEEEEIITADNNTDFYNLLQIEDEYSSDIGDFASKYSGKTIMFDGCISYKDFHGNYNTRYNILIESGDYINENLPNLGPLFRFRDVNHIDLGITDELSLPSYIDMGKNVRVTAVVGDFNSEMGILDLEPILVEER